MLQAGTRLICSSTATSTQLGWMLARRERQLASRTRQDLLGMELDPLKPTQHPKWWGILSIRSMSMTTTRKPSILLMRLGTFSPRSTRKERGTWIQCGDSFCPTIMLPPQETTVYQYSNVAPNIDNAGRIVEHSWYLRGGTASAITGQSTVVAGATAQYCTTPVAQRSSALVRVKFTWGDGTYSFSSWGLSGLALCDSHTWGSGGDYTVRAQVQPHGRHADLGTATLRTISVLGTGVNNPGFETGSVSPWQLRGSCDTFAASPLPWTGRYGSYSGYAIDSSGSTPCGFYQYVAASPGDSFVGRARFKVDSGVAQLWVEFRESTSESGGLSEPHYQTTTCQCVQDMMVTSGAAPSWARFARIMLYVPTAQTATVYGDGFSLEKQ